MCKHCKSLLDSKDKFVVECLSCRTLSEIGFDGCSCKAKEHRHLELSGITEERYNEQAREPAAKAAKGAILRGAKSKNAR